jgi:hypothetical protein
VQFERWAKAVDAGMKTVDDILAMARSKGSLTADQEKQIKDIKKSAAAPDPFVSELERAEREGEGA